MNKETIIIEEPPIARLLFADPRLAWLWLLLRLYLGWAWWEAGWHKFSSRGGWIMERRVLGDPSQATVKPLTFNLKDALRQSRSNTSPIC